jgi:hypothetical protein
MFTQSLLELGLDHAVARIPGRDVTGRREVIELLERALYLIREYPDHFSQDAELTRLAETVRDLPIALRFLPDVFGEIRTDASMDADPPWHSVDFYSVRCTLGTFTFTTNQRAVVKALWEDWEAGGCGLSHGYLLEKAGGVTEDREGNSKPRLKDLFKDHPGWGTLIVQSDRKDGCRLSLQPRKT